MFMAFTPFFANTLGWAMTELGRQPWIVDGLLLTKDANSPLVSNWQVAATLIGFTLIFTVLGGIAFWIFLRHVRQGDAATAPDSSPVLGGSDHNDLTLAY